MFTTNKTAMFANIGRCVLLCQQIELALAYTIVSERAKVGLSPEIFIEEFAKLRGLVLESLKKELIDLKATNFDFKHLDTVIERRNWLIHRLTMDERMIRTARSPDDYSDQKDFFESAYLKIRKSQIAHTTQLGDPAPPSLSGKKLMETSSKKETNFKRHQRRGKKKKGGHKKKKTQKNTPPPKKPRTNPPPPRGVLRLGGWVYFSFSSPPPPAGG